MVGCSSPRKMREATLSATGLLTISRPVANKVAAEFEASPLFNLEAGSNGKLTPMQQVIVGSTMAGYYGIHYIPLFLFILFPFTFLGTYLAAVWLGHVEPNFPYISDAATYSPESCVFGQLVNLGAALLGVLVYVRYCEVCQYYELYPLHPKVHKLNKRGLWLGLVSAFGLSIVANFQETNVKYVHLFGATMCFGMGCAYFFLQAICSYHMQPISNSIMVAHFRIGLSIVSTIFFFLATICGIWSHIKYHGTDPTKWYPGDGGWALHVVSTASEWIVAICFCFYILTFNSEFSVMSFSHPQIYLDTSHVLLDQREAESVS